MGFFDKVTKAVGDAVDKGKKDIDQFMRIQKINGEISAIEAKVAELRAEIRQNSQDAGQKAIALVRSGRLADPDLQLLADKLAGFERRIAAEEAAIGAKRADIERIKAEDAVPAAAPTAPPPLPVQPPAGDAPAPPGVPPLPNAAGACPQCGKPLTGGAFCAECGARVS